MRGNEASEMVVRVYSKAGPRPQEIIIMGGTLAPLAVAHEPLASIMLLLSVIHKKCMFLTGFADHSGPFLPSQVLASFSPAMVYVIVSFSFFFLLAPSSSCSFAYLLPL